MRKFEILGKHTLLAGIRYEQEAQLDHTISILNNQNIFEDQTEFRQSTYGVSLPDGKRSIYTAFLEKIIGNFPIN